MPALCVWLLPLQRSGEDFLPSLGRSRCTLPRVPSSTVRVGLVVHLNMDAPYQPPRKWGWETKQLSFRFRSFWIITKQPKRIPKWLSYGFYVTSSAWCGECSDDRLLMESGCVQTFHLLRLASASTTVSLCSQWSFPRGWAEWLAIHSWRHWAAHELDLSPHTAEFLMEVCCECKWGKILFFFFLMYRSWFFGTGFYAKMVFTCGVGFFSTFFNKNRFFKRKWKLFNQLVNDFCTKILRTYCLLSEDYVNSVVETEPASL